MEGEGTPTLNKRSSILSILVSDGYGQTVALSVLGGSGRFVLVSKIVLHYLLSKYKIYELILSISILPIITNAWVVIEMDNTIHRFCISVKI